MDYYTSFYEWIVTRIVLDSVALNMSDMFYQHNYGTIKIDDPVAEVFYVVQFTSMPYTLQDSL